MSHVRPDVQYGSRGFTIVEFMVATTIFSVMMMVITFGIMHISKIYQRSINASRTQAVTRNILDMVSQSLQYSGGDVLPATASPDTLARCIGGARQYLYRLHTRRESTAQSVMTTRQVEGAACTAVNIQNETDPNVVGQQLIPVNMRLANFEIKPVDSGGSLYYVVVKVAYGENEVLDNYNTADASCKPGTGSEYCAVSELSTIIQRRL